MATRNPGHRPLPTFYRFAPLVTFLAVAVVNFLPIGERRFEDDADTLVTAAGYAFSIWGIIFTGLIGFSVLLATRAEVDTPGMRRAVRGLLVAGVASILFVPISIHGDQLLGFLDVAAHLVALIYAYGGLREHVRTAPPQSRKVRFWFYGPSMYLGWISAATVIAASLALEQLGFRVSDQVALVLALVLVTVLFNVGSRFLAHADAVYGLTVAWALVGVGVEQLEVPLLPWACFVGAGLLVVSFVIRLARREFAFYATPGYYEEADAIIESLRSE